MCAQFMLCLALKVADKLKLRPTLFDSKPATPARHPDSDLHPSSKPRTEGTQTTLGPSASAVLNAELPSHGPEGVVTRQAQKPVKQARESLQREFDAAFNARVESIQKEYDISLHKAQQQAAEQIKQAKASFAQVLHSKDCKLALLQQQLAVADEARKEIQHDQALKDQELAALRAEILTNTEEIQTLKLAIDGLQFELDDAKCKGSELLTFQGLTTSQANQATLKLALKDLSSACEQFALLICDGSYGMAQNPTIFDLQQIEQRKQAAKLNSCSIRHTVLCALDAAIFNGFRCFQLCVGFNRTLDSMQDSESHVLQLRLEKRRADSWLQLLTSDTAGTTAAPVIQRYSTAFVDMLLSYQVGVQWNQAADLRSALTAAAARLVSAACKAQVIASAMHSQLIRIVVPGLFQNMTFASSTVVEWMDLMATNGWPGVMPLNKQYMQGGMMFAASAGQVPESIEAAAVFCQEPGVVQVAERVGELPEFGAQQPLQEAYKVLVKPRMVVAR